METASTGMIRRARAARIGALALCAGAVSAALLVQIQAAHAAPTSVSAPLSTTGVQTTDAAHVTHIVNITAGDSVVFSAGTPPLGTLGFAVAMHAASFPGGSPPRLGAGPGARKFAQVFFPVAGSYPFTWTPYNAINAQLPTKDGATSATIVVAPVESASPSQSASSTSPTGPSSESAAAASRTALPRGFIGPSDHGRPTTRTSTVVTSPTGTLNLPTESTSTAAAPAPGSTPDQTLQAQLYPASSSSPPTALAVVSILALASVAGTFAFQYLGGRELLSSLRR